MQVDSLYKNKPLFPAKGLDTDLIEGLGRRLSKLALQQVQKRQVTENRWFDDLEQYSGQYDEETWQAIVDAKGSQAFENITRKKALTAESRLLEMAMPTNDRNFSISPTPVPDLLGVDVAGLSDDEIMDIARKKAGAMENEIDDQLTECGFHDSLRQAIHEMCVFGNGVLKAPVLYESEEKNYLPLSEGVFDLELNRELKPGVEFVSLFDFFPDMSARKFSQCGFYFERKYLSKERLRELKELPGYLADAIEDVVAVEPSDYNSHDGNVTSVLRALSGQTELNRGLYLVWEYNGSLKNKELLACGCETGIENDSESLDCTVIFVGDTVIKAALHPLEEGGVMYHVMPYEKNDSGLFDFGVPYLLRNEQRTVNSSLRKIHDNGTLSSSPQIIFNSQIVKPLDGDYSFYPGKMWELMDKNASVRDAFASFDIPNNQAQLLNIYQTAKQAADEVTGIPMLQQGEKGSAPDTATGMSMLMNNSNVWLRRILKSIDDVVTGVVSAFYDWNMQNNPNPEIKGDFKIKAKGSATLLVRETQSQFLLNLATLAQQQNFSGLTKWSALYRKLIQSMQLPADDLVKTDKELAAEQQQPNPEAVMQQEMLKVQLEKVQAEIDQLKSNTTVKNVDGLFSSIQAAIELAKLNPAISIDQLLSVISNMADEIYKSAGGQDYNGFPIVQAQLQPQVVDGGEGQSLTSAEVLNQPDINRENTHPQYPPNADVGMMKGIDS